MAILGAHMSIVGGCDQAVEAAARLGMDCVQLFSKNNNQWKAKPLTDEDGRRFRDALARHRIQHTLIHDSYLINLAAPDPAAWQKSVDSFWDELQRAELLGVPYVVTHPGAFTTSTEAEGIARIAQALNEILARSRALRVEPLLENTAGQGSALGWRFEQLAAILQQVEQPERVRICLDTCHLFAAGYELRTAKEFKATFAEFDRIIGLEKLRAFHVNDSLKDLGSRVDRHAAIGEGKLGLEPFRWLLNDKRFRHIPMYLETPKGTRDGLDLDAINLRTLRGLIKSRARVTD